MLAFTQRGRLPLQIGEGRSHDGVAQRRTDEKKSTGFSRIETRSSLHTSWARENWPEVRTNLDREAAAHGVHKEILKIVPDSNGRPVFEIFNILE